MITKRKEKGKDIQHLLHFESGDLRYFAKPDEGGMLDFDGCYNKPGDPNSIYDFEISADDGRVNFTYDDNKKFELNKNYNTLDKKLKTKVKLNECLVTFNEDMHIASMFINISDDDKGKDDKRGKQLQLIANKMEEIIEVQKNKIKHSKILFRDMKTQKLELLNFEKFKDRIYKLCEEYNKSEHKDYLGNDWKIDIPDNIKPTKQECCIKRLFKNIFDNKQSDYKNINNYAQPAFHACTRGYPYMNK